MFGAELTCHVRGMLHRAHEYSPVNGLCGDVCIHLESMYPEFLKLVPTYMVDKLLCHFAGTMGLLSD